ncbi:hypothetical protein C4552_03355 [Candidatus Parcubacteria bacterium]|nr:MAG: hypothetical protein C4552_03355 [Candidatus Parcubacteria bacterium]
MLTVFASLSALQIAAIAHVVGVVLGMGSAFVTDVLFPKFAKKGSFTKSDVVTIRTVSALVWAGVALIVITGGYMVAQDIEGHLASDKFLAKMTIVAVVVVNGAVFHFVHLPILERSAGRPFRQSAEFMRNRTYLAASGAISLVSWLAAFLLGSLRRGNYDYFNIIGWYAAILVIALLGSFFMKDRVFPHE